MAGQTLYVETTQHTARKLRLFSGKVPVPSGEVDFKTWKLIASQLMADRASESEKKRTVLGSLLNPALVSIDPVASELSATECIAFLDSLYGSVSSGLELQRRFLVTYQEDKEGASEYLQKLYMLVWKRLSVEVWP